MKKIYLNLFPNGVSKALTLSYDDGRAHDRQLIDIMNRHGITGTFHLNSGLFGMDGYVTAEEIGNLYKGHEISAHTSTHPFMEIIPAEGIATQLLEDRRRLEELAHYPVRGMSYPFGTYSPHVMAALPALGIEYSRTVQSHGSFGLPANWLEWHPSCHQQDMLRLGKDFLELKSTHPHMQLLYVWGHSFEFDYNNNWSDMEQFCEMMGGRQDIWYATNIQILDYVNALRALRFTVAQDRVYNPSGLDVWITAEGEAYKISAGQTVMLG